MDETSEVEYSENYSLNFHRVDTNGCMRLQTNFDNEYLPEVLSKVREFLVASGWTYLDTLVAISEDGKEWSSDDA